MSLDLISISEHVKKNVYLSSEFQEISAMDFYRDVFPVGSFERRGCFDDKKPNGIVTVISKDKEKGYSQSTIVFDDLEEIKDVNGTEFVITNCISYSGRNRTSKNGYSLYGLIIDLDYVTEYTLIDLVFQMQGGVLPMATYLVNSGTGIHVYYVFNEPIPLYDWVIESLNKLKKGLTDKVWNQYTSTEKNKQYQNIFQGFRVVGSQTKLGEEYLVRAFKTGNKIDIHSLNEFVNAGFKFNYDEQRKNRLILETAKDKYPEWYQSRIVKQEARRTFIYNKAMYYKWIEYIKSGAYDGNRYHCLCVLFANAVKCGITKEKVLEDAYSLLSLLNDMTKHTGNNFSEKDLLDASRYYNQRSHFLKANTIRYKTKIDLPIGKRNGRKQKEHIKIMNFIRDEVNQNKNWRDGNGRPSVENHVYLWQRFNLDGKKADCHRATKLDPKTIRKWWRSKEQMREKERADFCKEWKCSIVNEETVKIPHRFVCDEIVDELTRLGFEKFIIEKETLQEKADKIVFAESEMTVDFMEQLARNGVRSVNVVLDDEYESVIAEGFSDWLLSQKN